MNSISETKLQRTDEARPLPLFVQAMAHGDNILDPELDFVLWVKSRITGKTEGIFLACDDRARAKKLQ